MGIDGGIGGSLHPVVSSPILQIRCFHPHQMSSVQKKMIDLDMGIQLFHRVFDSAVAVCHA